MLNIIAAILVFGLIVLVHEFGHFLLAKANGIGVVEFSIGMGPRLVSRQKGETRYSLKLLPFGGSCMMLGEDEKETDPKAFNNKPVWARISVVFSGPAFNFILAFLFAVIIVMNMGYQKFWIDGVTEGSPAAEAGLQPGDVITKVNSRKIDAYEDVQVYMLANPGETLRVRYERPSEDGTSWETRETMVTPEYSETEGRYLMGVTFTGQYVKPESLGEVVYYSAYQVKYCITSTFDSLKMLFTRQVEVDEAVAGPVRIVAMIGENVEESREIGVSVMLLTLCYWCLILSASLGIMNLLPLPALDGGRLVFLLLEAVRGKGIDQEKEGMVHMAGLLLLMVLMIFVLFNDIRSFF